MVYKRKSLFNTCFCFILFSDSLLYGRHQLFRDQRDDTAAKSAAGHAYATFVANHSFDDFYQSVNLRHGDFEIIAHRGMRLRHQLAHTFQVALLQRAGSFNGAGVFSQDMPHAFRHDWVQLMCNSVELFNGDIAQGWLLEETRTGFALFTTGVVFAANRYV